MTSALTTPHCSRREFLRQTATGLTALSALSAGINLYGAPATGQGSVRTVLGLVAPDKLGATLMHEHVPIVDWSELYEVQPGPVDPVRAEMLSKSVEHLKAFQDSLGELPGPGAIVECTPIRVGRYPELLREIAKQTPVHIIACTGFWGEGLAAQHPWATKLAMGKDGVRKIADLYVRELTHGMEDPHGALGAKFTDVKAGIIKCATSAYLRPVEKRCHLAAARASIETGAPITTHTTNGGGLEQAQLFLREKVPAQKIIIGHQGNRDDREHDDAHEYHRQIVETGCYIQFDRVGGTAYEPAKVAQQIKRLIDSGHIHQVLVSHDAAVYVYTDFTAQQKNAAGWDYKAPDYTVVTAQLIPELVNLDVSAVDVRKIMVENPARVLAF